ncbi:MAG: response regulator transcription factor [Acidobacteria bacterium]|nr:response regulator transcription factor [Acidobacteriota bacterium]
MSETRRPVRIAIADDHQIFRDGLRRLLESEPGFEVVAEAADGIEAVRVTRETRPDVLLLDVTMPHMTGIETLADPDVGSTCVILLTAAIDPSDLLRAVELGARGVVLKESATRQLIEGIHEAMEGKLLIGPEIAEHLAQAVRRAGGPRARPYGLTPREAEIVEAIAAGDSNREIATRLDISLQTVKHHLTSVFDKTGTSTRLELALFAIRNGLADAR